ncbi:MAG: hypothetical protein ACFCUQ_12195 [Kiloniellales bacterium]
MAETNSDRSQQLLQSIDEALARFPALTEQQLEDVRRLRAELQDHCRSGRLDEAKACEKLALTIIREGAPVPE